MKGMFRLALMSYVVVGAACAPAFAMQEPGIAPARLVALNSASVERPGAPAEMGIPVASTPSASPRAVHLPRASAMASETLAVSVRGPAEVRAATTASYRAAVQNGKAARYYFWWFTASCARRVGCAPSSYTLVAEGLGRDSADVTFGAASAERDVVVQVAEVDGVGRTGSSPMFVTLGPAQRPTLASTPARPTCDWFAGSFYPHTGDYTDPRTGRTWTRKFRRDYCGNRVQWDPEG